MSINWDFSKTVLSKLFKITWFKFVPDCSKILRIDWGEFKFFAGCIVIGAPVSFWAYPEAISIFLFIVSIGQVHLISPMIPAVISELSEPMLISLMIWSAIDSSESLICLLDILGDDPIITFIFVICEILASPTGSLPRSTFVTSTIESPPNCL